MLGILRPHWLPLLCAGIMCSSAFGQRTDASPAAASVDKAVEDVVERVRADLARRQVKKLAVARFYYNGSAVAPVAKFIQRKIVGRALDVAGSDLVVMERQDMRLLAGENTLQWMIDGKTEAGFSESQAVLTGEILWDKGLGQALLSLRVIDTKTGLLISAPARVTLLSRDLQERFGIASTEPPGSDIFRIDPNVESAAASLATKLGAAKMRLSFAEPSAVAEKYRFPYRVLSAFLIDHLTSKGLDVLEREFLFHIAREQAAGQKDLNTVLIGNAVLQVDPDDSTTPDSPTFFVRAVGRQDGRIIAQSEFKLTRASTPLRTSGLPTVAMGTPGADEALAEVVAAKRRASDVRTSDSLMFVESFRLDDKSRERFDAIIEDTLSRAKEDTVGAMKAALLAESAKGPLALLAERISGQYTVRRDMKSASEFWAYQILEADLARQWNDEKYDSFYHQWRKSIHPQLRKGKKSLLDAVHGRCTIREVAPSMEGYVIGGANNQSVVFDYTVKTSWSGKYPAEVTITIDLTPMKERLVKVKAESNNEE
jgi:hypothetical protein